MTIAALFQKSKRYIKPTLGAMINYSHPLANGLTGAWLFNEGGGGVVRENAQGIYNGTYHGSQPYSTKSILGETGSFVYANSNYVTTVAPSYQFTNFTIAARMIPTSTGPGGLSNTTLVCNDVNPPTTYGTAFNLHQNKTGAVQDGYVSCWYHSSAGTWNTIDSGSAILSLGTSISLTWVKSGATSTLYQNGVQISTTTFATSDIAYGANSYLIIGQDTNTPNTFADIDVDYIYIYNRPMSAQEVWQLYSDPYAIVLPTSKITGVESGAFPLFFGSAV